MMEDKKEEKKEEAGEKINYSEILKKTEATAARIEAANKKTEELIERQEKLAVENALGGKADAGEQPAKKKEETPEEYAQKLFEGKVNPLEDDEVI